MAPKPRILPVAAIRELDRRAIEEIGIPGVLLMERAGAAVAQVAKGILRSSPTMRTMVLCGKGNNGGDGFVVARILHDAGFPVEAWVAGGLDSFPEGTDAGVHLALAQAAIVPIHEMGDPAGFAQERKSPDGETLVVDALLGTGLGGDVRSPLRDLMEWVNRGTGQVVSVDVPSGLDGDTGEILGVAVRADQTVTFGAAKPGFFVGQGPEVVGTLTVDEIGLPAWLLEAASP